MNQVGGLHTVGMSMKVPHVNRVVLLVSMMTILPAWSQGVLNIGTPAVDGNNVTVPVYLEGNIDDGVAALDFTLRYDPSVLAPNGVRAGDAALAADKGVQYNMTSPGNYVVMMFGLNQSTMDAGKVADVSFRRVNVAAGAETNLSIDGTTLASLAGQTIASQGSSATFQLDGISPDDPAPEDPVTPPDEPGDDPDVPGEDEPVPVPPDGETPPSDDPNNPPPASGNPGSPVVPALNDTEDQQDPRGTPGTAPRTRAGLSPQVSDTASKLSQLNRMAREFDRKRAGIPSPPQNGDGSVQGPSSPASAPNDAVKTTVLDRKSPSGELRGDRGGDALEQMASLAPSRPAGNESDSNFALSTKLTPSREESGFFADRRVWVLAAILLAFGAGLLVRKRLLP
jgi:hypothetical protein